MGFYPVSLELEGRDCLVIGGGRVAVRKARGLLACGGLVTVISPELVPELAAMEESGEILWQRRPYSQGDLAGFFLVIAATDDQDVQRRIHEEAEKLGVLLNVADVPQYCNFILPATLRRGDLAISVSTGGRSPALARNLRLQLEKTFGEEYILLVEILGALRPVILAEGRSQEENEKVFLSLDHRSILDWIRAGDHQGLREYICRTLEHGGCGEASRAAVARILDR